MEASSSKYIVKSSARRLAGFGFERRLATVSVVALCAAIAGGAEAHTAEDAPALGEIQVAAAYEAPLTITSTIALAGVQGATMASGQVDGASSALDEIKVTGTRIRQSGMNTPTPVTVMSADDLQNFAPGQMIDALDQVPQFMGNASPSTAASKADSAGASNLNLRGLSSKRTLVLLNGERVVPSNRLGTVDINLFPADLVQRVETVTGGASAAYGTDAVAGVVNFILDTDFTGIKGHAQGGITGRGDNENYALGLSAGAQVTERLHVLASFDAYASNRLDNVNGRDWYQGGGLVQNPDWPTSGPQYLTYRAGVNSTQYTNGGLIDAPGTSINRLMFLSDGSVTPFVLGDPAIVGRGSQNEVGGSGYNPYDYNPNVRSENYPQGTRSGSFIPDNSRNSAFARLDYDLTDSVRIYVQGLWGRNKANSAGTLPKAFGNWANTIFQGNAFLPAEIEAVMEAEGIQSFKLQRYNTAADIAQDRMITTNNTYSVSAGFDADAFDGWQVQGYYQVGWNHNHLLLHDFLRVDRLPLALDAVRDPATGAIVCRVTQINPGGPYDDCVPLNLFGVGNASKEAVDWVTGDMVDQGNTRQDNAEITANGNIYEGWGAGPVSLAVGASYRKQQIHQTLSPSELVNQPTLAELVAAGTYGMRGVPGGNLGMDDYIDSVNLDNFSGSFNVKELFAETLVPLVSGVSMVQQLNLDLAARWADYSGSGTVWAWKAGLDWQVTDELRLRGTASRDVRAASLAERFDSQGLPANIEDHDLDLTYATFQIQGGNPDVDPEKADTYTIGAVYQPTYIDGLSVSLDWYKVKVKGAIDLLGPQQIVDACFNNGGALCDRIERDPTTNRISLLQNTYVNLGGQDVNGLDLETSYNTGLTLFGGGAESVTARVLASWTFKNSVTDTDGNTIDYNGEVGASAHPDFRATASVNYGNGPFNAYIQERYVDSGINNVTYVEGVNIADNSVPRRFYTDLRLGYTLGTDDNWQLSLTVTNLFDEDPPFIPSASAFGSLGTNEALYDVLGRRFVAGVSFRY